MNRRREFGAVRRCVQLRRFTIEAVGLLAREALLARAAAEGGRHLGESEIGHDHTMLRGEAQDREHFRRLVQEQASGARIPFLGFDTDRSHGSLLRFYADFAAPVVIDRYEGLDRIVEAAARSTRSMMPSIERERPDIVTAANLDMNGACPYPKTLYALI
jgi:hypothetical protein